MCQTYGKGDRAYVRVCQRAVGRRSPLAGMHVPLADVVWRDGTACIDRHRTRWTRASKPDPAQKRCGWCGLKGGDHRDWCPALKPKPTPTPQPAPETARTPGRVRAPERACEECWGRDGNHASWCPRRR